MAVNLLVHGVQQLSGLQWSDLLLLSLASLLLSSCALPIVPQKGHTHHPNGVASTTLQEEEEDHLTPYLEGGRRPRRSLREVRECQHADWENRTYEVFNLSTTLPPSDQARYKLHKFADTTAGRRYLVGTIAFIESPFHTFSVLEPEKKGGCDSTFYYTTRSTVQETASNRKFGCKLAANGGYFTMTTGRCLGNIVSDGTVVQTTPDLNANFGIRQDGSIVIGYIPEEEISDRKNPFRQLVTGVVWLVRNGTNYVNESMKLECSSHEDTGRMETFVNVVSARSALGHDREGRLVMVQIEGQTHRRG